MRIVAEGQQASGACGVGGPHRAECEYLSVAAPFAACMRRHGFANLPDGWSGNIGQLISAGIDPNSPQLSAALTKCGPW